MNTLICELRTKTRKIAPNSMSDRTFEEQMNTTLNKVSIEKAQDIIIIISPLKKPIRQSVLKGKPTDKEC